VLAEGQPAMANLRALSAKAKAVEESDSFTSWLARRAAYLDELPERFAANAWSWIEAAARVLTLSRSSAVAAVVEGAWRLGWGGMVVVLDGTAAGRGVDQARRLAATGHAISQPDATVRNWLDDEATVVLVGADAIGPKRFLNAVGTGMLLELASARQVTRVLVAESGKDVEEADLDEICARCPRHHEAAGREWSIFEPVSLELVSGRVSE
jgi:translation initiation factor 2B subunit (eIF-2B alpha/beta/delta family)